MSTSNKAAQDTTDPLIGQVIFTVGSSQEDVWDDSELIEYWDKAKEAYKARQNKTNAPPFGTNKKAMKGRVEKPTGPVFPQKKAKKTTQQRSFTPPQDTPMLQQQGDNQDALTQMIMAWYYAGYYAGIYAGSNGREQ